MGGAGIEDGAALVAINGWASLVKRMLPPSVTDRFMPLIVVALGVFYVFSVKPDCTGGVTDQVMLGVALGLTAAGTFSAFKKPVGATLDAVNAKINGKGGAPPVGNPS